METRLQSPSENTTPGIRVIGAGAYLRPPKMGPYICAFQCPEKGPKVGAEGSKLKPKALLIFNFYSKSGTTLSLHIQSGWGTLGALRWGLACSKIVAWTMSWRRLATKQHLGESGPPKLYFLKPSGHPMLGEHPPF